MPTYSLFHINDTPPVILYLNLNNSPLRSFTWCLFDILLRGSALCRSCYQSIGCQLSVQDTKRKVNVRKPENPILEMSDNVLNHNSPSLETGAGSPLSPAPGAALSRSSVLSNKLTGVLSRSYADSEIRDTLSILDARGVVNDVSARQTLRLDAQQEMIECNGAIVQDFGLVAEVILLSSKVSSLADDLEAIEAYRHNDEKSQ